MPLFAFTFAFDELRILTSFITSLIYKLVSYCSQTALQRV